MNIKYTGNLQKLLFPLLTIEKIDLENLFSDDIKSHLMQSYSMREIAELKNTLVWALEEKISDYKTVLPGIRFSNAQIRLYLEMYLQKMNEAFDPQELEQPINWKFDKAINILAAEDSQIKHGFISYLLSDSFISVTSAFTTSEAVQILDKERFDLIIVSLHEKKESAVHFIEAYLKSKERKKEKILPILVIIEKEESSYLKTLYHLGISAHLHYPLFISELEQKISDILGHD